MAYYTVLNFEDAYAPSLTGEVKGGSDAKAMGAGAAAEGTANVYKRRAARDSKWYDKKKVVYYGCRELIARDRLGDLSKQEVNSIREDISKSKTIAFVVHGQPSETEHGFSTQGSEVCGWGELGQLALLLLPNSEKTHNVVLIMCYGARSEDSTLNHEGLIPPEQLKTSFAYKFFRRICELRNVRMSGFTGAVSNDAQLAHTVEREGEVMIALGRSSP